MENDTLDIPADLPSADTSTDAQIYDLLTGLNEELITANDNLLFANNQLQYMNNQFFLFFLLVIVVFICACFYHLLRRF